MAAVFWLALALFLVQWQLLASAYDNVPPKGMMSEGALARLCANNALEREVRSKFRNTVLVINTNYEKAARRTSRFLHRFYRRFFDNIIIISEKSIPELNVEGRGHARWRGEWELAFWHLPKVVLGYPFADGYLWTNDDVAINLWNLLKGNTSKLWLTNLGPFYPFDPKAKVRDEWEEDWAARVLTRERALLAYSDMEEGYRQQHDSSVTGVFGAADSYPKRVPDLYYIPRQYAKKMCADLKPVYREAKLGSEIANPMMFYALEDPKN